MLTVFVVHKNKNSEREKSKKDTRILDTFLNCEKLKV